MVNRKGLLECMNAAKAMAWSRGFKKLSISEQKLRSYSLKASQERGKSFFSKRILYPPFLPLATRMDLLVRRKLRHPILEGFVPLH